MVVVAVAVGAVGVVGVGVVGVGVGVVVVVVVQLVVAISPEDSSSRATVRPKRCHGGEGVVEVPRPGVVVALGPVAMQTDPVGEVGGLSELNVEWARAQHAHNTGTTRIVRIKQLPVSSGR